MRAEDLRSRGLPRALKEYEPIPPEWQVVFSLFSEIATSRPPPALGAMGGAFHLPLPGSTIDDYLDRYQLRGIQRRELRHHIRRMDVMYLDHVNKPAGKAP